MVATPKTTGIGAADAGLTAPVKDDATHGSQISTSASKIILSSPASIARIDAPMKNQTMLSLPLDEPETLNLPQFNTSSNGPISPVPDTNLFATDKLSGPKQPLTTIDDQKYFAEVSDFYETWNSDQLDVDIELFPELF